MSENWVVQNLNYALGLWNDRLQEIWELLLIGPEEFRGGVIWNAIVQINGAMQAVGLALLVVFFAAGFVKTTADYMNGRRMEVLWKAFLRFAIARALITYGMELMVALFDITQGMVRTIVSATTYTGSGQLTLPEEIITSIEECGFLESVPLWMISLLASVFVIAESFVLVLTVYGRFFKIYLYTAISPVPFASFAGEGVSRMGVTYLRSYFGVCLEGVIILLCCVIFSGFAAAPPQIQQGVSAVVQVFSYMGEVIFDMLILVGTVKIADHVSKEMMGV